MPHKDPICGNCFAPLSKHFHEDKIYCFMDTNGDVFSAEPPDGLIFERIVERFPEFYQGMVDEWKRENGHI